MKLHKELPRFKNKVDVKSKGASAIQMFLKFVAGFDLKTEKNLKERINIMELRCWGGGF